MKKLSPFFTYFFAALAFLLCFQNCGGYSGNSQSLYDRFPAVVVESGCAIAAECALRPDNIGLYVNPEQYLFINSTAAKIDVAGFCNTGLYPHSSFEYQIVGQSSTNQWTPAAGSASGNNGLAMACDPQGRFAFQIPVPSTFFGTSITYEVRLNFIVYDEKGTPVNGGNGNSEKSIKYIVIEPTPAH